MRICSSVTGWLILIAAAGASAAETSSPVRLSGEVGISAQHFQYTEFNDAGAILDRETATLPGLSLALLGEWNNTYALGEFSYQKGTARYVGKTNSGAALRTDTRETIADAAIQAGRWFTPEQFPRYALYGGVGYHQWQRDIKSTPSVGGLFETYKWWYGFIGAKAELFKQERSDWLLDIRVTQPIRPKIVIDFQGAYAVSPELNLGERPGIRVALPWRFNQKEGTTLIIEPYFEQWNLGRSADSSFRSGSLTLTVHEPESETKNTGIRVLWRRAFY